MDIFAYNNRYIMEKIFDNVIIQLMFTIHQIPIINLGLRLTSNALSNSTSCSCTFF